jgi:hypothetical protein
VSGKRHEQLIAALRVLPEDYAPWGMVERWADPDRRYPDCSVGCRCFLRLNDRGNDDWDWGVCVNPESHRAGLLTFEHQGCQKAVLK